MWKSAGVNRELEQLLCELRDEGILDSAGQFTMDAAKAREKLALRQAREAGLWLTKLIQCAHMWEASSLRLRQKREEARAELTLGAREVDLGPWLSRIHQVEIMADPTFGPLATAFQAALADGCEYLELSPPGLRLDGTGLAGPREQYRPGPRLDFTFAYKRREPWWNALLHLRPPRRSAENFLAASRKAGLALPRVEMDGFEISDSRALLGRHCGSTPSSVRCERVWLSSAPARELMLYPPLEARRGAVEQVNERISVTHPKPYQALRQWAHESGRDLPLPSGPLAGWLTQAQATGLATPPPASQNKALAVRGLVSWNCDSHAPACILPVKYGIVLEAMPFTSLPPGVTIWLSSSRWRTDIHQKKVVQDDVCRQLCNWVSDQFDDMQARARSLVGEASLAELKAALLRRGAPARSNSGAFPF